MEQNQLAIEYHPENGDFPWVVATQSSVRLWLAHRNVEDAAKKLTDQKYVDAIKVFLSTASA